MLRLFPLILLLLAPLFTRGEEIAPPSEELRTSFKLAPFYKKCLLAQDFPIVASDKVSDYALHEAKYLIDHMLQGRDDLRRELVKQKIRLAVMAYNELTTQIPEHSDLNPGKYWDKRARGLGATRARPAVSCAEENLLQFPGDPYRGENILIHEFAHGIHEIALKGVDKTFDARLKAAFEQGMAEGLWKGTYAATNRAEYWAEGVQSWFDANLAGKGQHNDIATRTKIEKYDPRLSKLLAEVFKDNAWKYQSPSVRKQAEHLAGFNVRKAPRFAWPAELVEWYEKYQKEKKGK